MKLSYCNEYAANANIREYLNQDIRNGKLAIFFQGYQKKNGEKQTKSTDHKKIYFTQGHFPCRGSVAFWNVLTAKEVKTDTRKISATLKLNILH